jgi:signal peptidase II
MTTGADSAMLTAVLTSTVVLITDQAVKLLIRTGRFDGVRLGRFGTLRMASGRLWLQQLTGRNQKVVWLWLVSAGTLVAASTWIPAAAVFVGLLLGGSMSNAMEGSLRGTITDYVCLRFWPAFNLADVALTVGAVGVGVVVLQAIDAIAH